MHPVLQEGPTTVGVFAIMPMPVLMQSTVQSIAPEMEAWHPAMFEGRSFREEVRHLIPWVVLVRPDPVELELHLPADLPGKRCEMGRDLLIRLGH